MYPLVDRRRAAVPARLDRSLVHRRDLDQGRRRVGLRVPHDRPVRPGHRCPRLLEAGSGPGPTAGEGADRAPAYPRVVDELLGATHTHPGSLADPIMSAGIDDRLLSHRPHIQLPRRTTSDDVPRGTHQQVPGAANHSTSRSSRGGSHRSAPPDHPSHSANHRYDLLNGI